MSRVISSVKYGWFQAGMMPLGLPAVVRSCSDSPTGLCRSPTMLLKLFACIKGLKHISIPITIQSSQRVGDLQEAIIKKAPDVLGGVLAYRLVLYKVNLPDDKNLQEQASQVSQGELTEGSQELSDLFLEQPRAKRVSIIVEIPKTGE